MAGAQWFDSLKGKGEDEGEAESCRKLMKAGEGEKSKGVMEIGKWKRLEEMGVNVEKQK